MVLAQTQAPADLGIKLELNTVINIRLVTLPLDSGTVNSLVKILTMNMYSHVKIINLAIGERLGWME